MLLGPVSYTSNSSLPGHVTGMVDGGSPFPGTSLAMPSPGTRGWPSSPSVQGPSPASHHLATSPGHPALHSPQTHKDGEHSKVSGETSEPGEVGSMHLGYRRHSYLACTCHRPVAVVLLTNYHQAHKAVQVTCS